MMKERKYTHILFDLDGTLVNSGAGVTNAVSYALRKMGINETDTKKLYRFLGPPLDGSFRKYYGFSPEKAKAAVVAYREYYREIGIHENELYDGIKELLAALKNEGFVLWVATSKPTPFAKTILEELGILPYFSLVAGAAFDDSLNTKEKVIRHAMLLDGFSDTSRMLMVGDRFHDIEGAHACGIHAAAVLFGFGARPEFEEYGAEYIVETPADILNICLTLNA